VSEAEPVDAGQSEPSGNPTRKYIIIAVVLAVVIVVAAIILVVVALPSLLGSGEPTAAALPEATATSVPTFTPGPTKAPTNTPVPLPSPTPAGLVMEDTDSPQYEFDSAGARPSVEWTGFFGQVQDAAGGPVANVSVVVWYRDGTPASDVVQTDESGYYEIRLAEAPLVGFWSVQVLTDDLRPASKLFTFETDDNTDTGIQQIQVIWQQVP
jgi:hypothetical protein